jgi:hypothetical protein
MPYCEGGIQGAKVANQNLKDVIKERYGKIARGEQTFCRPSCGPTTTDQCLALGEVAKEDVAAKLCQFGG